jgi:hypothetical protein
VRGTFTATPLIEKDNSPFLRIEILTINPFNTTSGPAMEKYYRFTLGIAHFFIINCVESRYF